MLTQNIIFETSKKSSFHQINPTNFYQFQSIISKIISSINLSKYEKKKIDKLLHVSPGVGIDTIALAQFFSPNQDFVIFASEEALELYTLLERNLTLSGLSNLHIYNYTNIQSLSSLVDIDLIYIIPDIIPPIGTDKIMCSLSGIPLSNIINNILMSIDDNKGIILKLPVNFDIRTFRRSLYVNIIMNSYKLYDEGRLSSYILHIPLVKQFKYKALSKYRQIVTMNLFSEIGYPSIFDELVFYGGSLFDKFNPVLDSICDEKSIKLTLFMEHLDDNYNYSENTQIIIIDKSNVVQKLKEYVESDLSIKKKLLPLTIFPEYCY